jgi:hypothetical protein
MPIVAELIQRLQTAGHEILTPAALHKAGCNMVLSFKTEVKGGESIQPHRGLARVGAVRYNGNVIRAPCKAAEHC